MKTVLSAILTLTFALGASTSVFAADPAVEEAWRNTRAENLPHEWAIAEREAKAGSQVASSGAIQSDASPQNRTQTNTFEDKPWLYAH
jgi:hypothetical protein